MSSTLHDSVLVVDGSGCLGHHIVKQLNDDPYFSDIAVFDIKTAHNRVDGVKYIEGSLTSRDEVLRAIQEVNPRVIIHTASPKLMIQSKGTTPHLKGLYRVP
jgi:sterol-4alpha-carboxylate 3-dehydrogenase (decarboxylating)